MRGPKILQRIAAHPRVCGENVEDIALAAGKGGSPPRVRGKLGACQRDADGGGLTPACAGKTGGSGPPRTWAWAHPRVCGENPKDAQWVEAQEGSPPRVRGKRPASGWRMSWGGLTPACAGKTSGSTGAARSAPAHPRVCGENIAERIADDGGEGSPPRVRGKRMGLRHGFRARGLTPACAGKTRRPAPVLLSTGAHPRVCGENHILDADHFVTSGSPPRVRGKRSREVVEGRLVGLTPACAGKTPTGKPSPGTRGAHPRVCGENPAATLVVTPRAGSPPRVRGKPVLSATSSSPLGLTPACAGKTAPPTPPTAASKAHPRVCGENRDGAIGSLSIGGSPPRVRGKLFLTWAFTAQAGQILETLGPSAFSGSYSFPGARANGGQCRARRRGLCTGPALGRPLGAS